MTRYIFVRAVWMVIILFTILSLNFVLLKLAPDYPPTTEDARGIYFARQVIDGYMTERTEDDPEIIAAIRSNEMRFPAGVFYFDNGDHFVVYEPVAISLQYFSWLGNVLTKWNWGLSTRVQVNTPVFQVLSDRMAVTIGLNLAALIFYIPIGFMLGIIAALRANKLTDNIISLGVMVFISVPTFVVMTMFLMYFGYNLGWLPTRFPATDAQSWIRFTGMILPVAALSFGSIAGLTRLTRAELREVLTSDFVLLARTKGLTHRQAVIRHAMRNSMVPLIPSVIGSFVGLLSGSVVIERIYDIPGTGRIFLRALTQSSYDYNLILAITAFYTAIGLLAVLLVDLSYGFIDPRIRMGARK